jgi:hypothetical protein
MGRHRLAASLGSHFVYHVSMTEDEHIQRHLDICQRVYERLVAEGKWLWPDSPKSDDVIESKDPKKTI